MMLALLHAASNTPFNPISDQWNPSLFLWIRDLAANGSWQMWIGAIFQNPVLMALFTH